MLQRRGNGNSIGDQVCKCRPGSIVRVSFPYVDLYLSLPPDTHIGATSMQLVEHFMEDGRCPSWVVNSQPKKKTLLYLKNACQIAKAGVTFKLLLTFQKMVSSWAVWLMKHLPTMAIVLSRATYKGRLRGSKLG